MVSKPGFQVGRDHILIIFIFLRVFTKTWSLPTRALVLCETLSFRVEKVQNLSAWYSGWREKGEWPMCELVAVGWQTNAWTD